MQNQYPDLNRPIRIILLASPFLVAFLIVLIDWVFGADIRRLVL